MTTAPPLTRKTEEEEEEEERHLALIPRRRKERERSIPTEASGHIVHIVQIVGFMLMLSYVLYRHLII